MPPPWLAPPVTIPEPIQGIVLATELFGIIANVFFLGILLRYVKKWEANKILMVAYHAAALIFLTCLFFPLLTVAASGRDRTASECVAPVPFIQATVIFQPLSLAVMAHTRWRIVKSSIDNTDPPNTKRYILGLVAFVVVMISIVHGVGSALGVPFWWTGRAMLCVRILQLWSVIFNMSFFCTAPYLAYCYMKLVSMVKEMTVDGGNEFVRLINVLIVFYYVTYLPFFVIFFLQFVTKVAVVANIGHQIAEWIHISHSAFAPVVSIVMTERYRMMAYAILTNQSFDRLSGVVSEDDSKKSITAGSRGSHAGSQVKSVTVKEAAAAKQVNVAPEQSISDSFAVDKANATSV